MTTEFIRKSIRIVATENRSRGVMQIVMMQLIIYRKEMVEEISWWWGVTSPSTITQDQKVQKLCSKS